jgi:YD repeat-containing protein
MSVKDGRANVTRYGFSRDGRPTTVTDALNRLVAHDYDRRSQAELTDARAVTRLRPRNRVSTACRPTD